VKKKHLKAFFSLYVNLENSRKFLLSIEKGQGLTLISINLFFKSHFVENVSAKENFGEDMKEIDSGLL